MPFEAEQHAVPLERLCCFPGICIIVKEIYTGTKVDRPEWKKLYKEVVKRAGSGEDIGGVNLWTDSNG